MSANARSRIGLEPWQVAWVDLPVRPSIQGRARNQGTARRCGRVPGSCPLPGDPDGDRAGGGRRQPAERVAVQVDHAAAPAGAPVDQLHVDAVARPAHGHGPAAPAADAERRTGRRVQSSRIGAGGMRSRPTCSTSWPCRATLCDGLAGGFGLGVALSSGFGANRLIRVCPWLERALLRLLEVADLDRRRRRAVVHGRQRRGRLLDGFGNFDRTEVAGIQGRRGGWGTGGGCRRGRQRADRCQEGKRHRSSDIQTAAPATARPSGRDMNSMDMRRRFAAAG